MEHGYVLAVPGTGRRSLRALRRRFSYARCAYRLGMADRAFHHVNSQGIAVRYAESYALGLGTALRKLNTEVTEVWEGKTWKQALSGQSQISSQRGIHRVVNGPNLKDLVAVSTTLSKPSHYSATYVFNLFSHQPESAQRA